MTINTIDNFLNDDGGDGTITKTEATQQEPVAKKRDELAMISDPSQATPFAPMEFEVEELDDDGDALIEAAENALAPLESC